MAAFTSLTAPELTIIVATSPLGLGHLRVTDALYHGLPKTASPILFGAKSPSGSAIYRFVSIHPITRKIMELLQTPPLDRPAAWVGRKMLPLQTTTLYKQIRQILNERFIVSKTVVLVAAHPIHAHQLGAIKEKLAKELAIRIILVVQVTDDSPQPIWYVEVADCIFVPSEYTKQQLKSYASKAHLKKVPIVVTAYPISPLLTEELSQRAFTNRQEQVDPHFNGTLHIAIPISGAAVGTGFTTTIINHLHTYASRCQFHVIAREAPFTKSFIQEMTAVSFVKLYTSTHDRMTVDNYEQVFKDVPIALEITKPSEQAFKTLTTPTQRGGAILLLAKPVGGQEYDNLHFLRNHGLMPNGQQMRHLWEKAEKQEHLEAEVFATARQWRALLLPEDPDKACLFILWCLQEKLLMTMMHYRKHSKSAELQSNGVAQFWKKVEELVEKASSK